MKEITLLGAITPDGKEITAVFTEDYKAMIRKHSAKRIFITISVFPDDATELQKGYYRKVVLPALQKGFREAGDDMTIEETHSRVRELCPTTSGKDIEDNLAKEDYSGLIEWSIRLCSQEFNIIVPEPQ
jgi:hypothetical protein